jgi:hypothetical protein
MSISSSTSSVSYTGNASTVTAYVVSFPFFDASDLKVYSVTSAGVSTLLAITTNYTVSGGNGSTGSVVTTAAIPATSTVIITRSVPYTQLTSLTTGDRLPAATIEKALDKVTMQAQQLSRNTIPDTAATSGSAPFVLGIGSAGGSPSWVSQTASAIADGSITTAKIAAAAITPEKLSCNGNITWDASGNLTAPTFTGTASVATLANGVAAGSVTPAGLAGSVGNNAWVSKTANYTAVEGDRVIANTTSSAFTITLPATPTLGTMVTFADAGRTWATNNLTVARNGNTIEGLSEDLVCNVSGKRIAAVYNGSTWRIY